MKTVDLSKVRHNKKPYLVWDGGDELDWEEFKYCLGLLVKKHFPEGTFKASLFTVSFLGTPRNGYSYFKTCSEGIDDAGYDMLYSLFKNYDLGTIEVYGIKNRKGLVFHHTHHDNPVNGDWVVVTPCSERMYNSFIQQF